MGGDVYLSDATSTLRSQRSQSTPHEAREFVRFNGKIIVIQKGVFLENKVGVHGWAANFSKIKD